MYSTKDLNFILYNNRSINGVVKNFMFQSKWDISKLIIYDNLFKKYKKLSAENSYVEINLKDLDINARDISITPKHLIGLESYIIDSHLQLLYNDKYKKELTWLLKRGITENIINKWKLGSMQYLVDTLKYTQLEHIGITAHPILKSLLDDGITGGGIVMPLFNNNHVINCTFRKLSDIGKLKYTQTIPDLNIWKTSNKTIENLYIVEGIFDMIALDSVGLDAVSSSTAMWSSPQLYQLLNLSTSKYTIIADNDRTGLRTAKIMYNILTELKKNVTIKISNTAKDIAEHILEQQLHIDLLEDTIITEKMIESKENQTFNFTKHLKNRMF